MTTGSEAPDAGKEDQQRRNRGGAASEDRSKGMEAEEPGSPFDSSEEDAGKTKKGA